MNTFDDPDVRYWRRIGAVVSLAVVTALTAGLAFVGGTAPIDHPILSVNCAGEGMPGTVFDDSGTHAALCAGHVSLQPRRSQARLDATLIPPPMPASSAVAEPLPPTF